MSKVKFLLIELESSGGIAVTPFAEQLPVEALSLFQNLNSPQYRRRDPEASFLYQTVQENWKTFEAEAEHEGRSLPFYVKKEFESFLNCGVLAHGFVRLKCEGCAHEKLVGFSCKKRGFCSSCCGRRMSESGIFLSEQVFPRVPIRQWVLSVPIPLRYYMAGNPKLMSKVLAITNRVIRRHYQVKGQKSGIDRPQTGAVTLIQRFGGSANLNIHFHELWMEGVFFKRDETSLPKFAMLPKTTNEEVADVLYTIRHRVVRLLIKLGYLEKDESVTGVGAEGFENSESLLSSVLLASTQNRIALGNRQGQPVRKVGSFGGNTEKPQLTGPLCATLGGFSLHANVYIPEDKPQKLEKLCRYVSRPPVAESRLFKQENGDVGYFLKSQWNDGTFAVSFSPMEFIEKLVALIPQPRIHLTRFYGVLAPNHAWRASVVPEPPKKNEDGSSCHHGRMKWALLLKRIFKIDLTKCPDCGGEVKFVAAIMKRDVVVKILDHLKLPSEQPRWSPPRAPPAMSFDF